VQFPVYIAIGALKIHPHLLFESLAYAIAFRLMIRNAKTDTIAFSQRT
jgi:phosphatidylglycerol---prolipoprotein diacylglyceryl transferase